MFGPVDQKMNDKRYKLLVKNCKDMLRQGSTVDDVIVFLHGRGTLINWLIYIVQDSANLQFKEAKERVENHSLWKGMVEESREIQRDLEFVINTDPDAVLRTDGATVIELGDN